MADDLDPLDARMLSAALAAGNDEIYDRPAGNAGCQATSAVHVDSSAPPYEAPTPHCRCCCCWARLIFAGLGVSRSPLQRRHSSASQPHDVQLPRSPLASRILPSFLRPVALAVVNSDFPVARSLSTLNCPHLIGMQYIPAECHSHDWA